MNVLGIDPGKSGALAFLDTSVSTCEVYPIPMTAPVKKTKQSRARSFVDVALLKEIIRHYAIDVAFMENVASSSQMGVVSAFTFGEGFGTLKGVVGAHDIPLILVTPQKWKRALKLPADKKETVRKASKLFINGDSVFYGPRGGVLDGLAEASCIALYGCLAKGANIACRPSVSRL
jgi:crossover junction endodeoxyribonuclease RuvC